MAITDHRLYIWSKSFNRHYLEKLTVFQLYLTDIYMSCTAKKRLGLRIAGRLHGCLSSLVKNFQKTFQCGANAVRLTSNQTFS